jgi:hypothetical protein
MSLVLRVAWGSAGRSVVRWDQPLRDTMALLPSSLARVLEAEGASRALPWSFPLAPLVATMPELTRGHSSLLRRTVCRVQTVKTDVAPRKPRQHILAASGHLSRPGFSG